MNRPTMKVLRRGDDVSILHADVATDKLEVGVYSVNFSKDRGFFLTAKEDLNIPSKIYGESSDFTDRIIRTYKTMGKGIGVLLSGPKGTGKTLDAKQVCIKSGCPVLTISSAYAGQGFSEFIQSIETPCVIFIDEFEKVYSDKEDEGKRNFFLTLMDGTAKSRHLYLLTSNETKIGEYFHSRPGRIRYHKEYQHLNDEMIREIVEDRLENKDLVEDAMNVLLKLNQLSIDSVTAILDECNIHNEGPSKFMDIFNVNSARPSEWNITMETSGVTPRTDFTEEEEAELKEEGHDLSYMARYFGEDSMEENLKKFFVRKPLRMEAHYVNHPFRSHYDRHRVEINRLREVDPKNYSDAIVRSVSWQPEDIKSFTETREGIVVVHRNGDKIVGTAVAPVSRNSY